MLCCCASCCVLYAVLLRYLERREERVEHISAQVSVCNEQCRVQQLRAVARRSSCARRFGRGRLGRELRA